AERWELVREPDDPPLIDRAPQDQLLRGERVEREQVERGDPRERQMVAVWQEITREKERRIAVGHAHSLSAAGVALDPVEADARKYFDGFGDELELRPGAGLDKDHVIGVADEKAVHVHRHAVALVGLLLPLPEHLRDDAEHRAAVEPEYTVAEDPHVETTDAHEASVWAAVEIRDL